MRPCPFCGSRRLHVSPQYGTQKVQCLDCCACGPAGQGDAEAQQRWNEQKTPRESTPTRPSKLRVIKVRPSHGGPWCVCDDWNGVGQMITDDGSYDFEIIDLTPEEYDAIDAIPDDFPGW